MAKKAIPKRGFYVYAITENEQVCYIGKGKNYRVLSHFKGTGNQILGQKIKENPSAYDWEILKEFESEAECLQYEKYLIKGMKGSINKLYNTTHYSEGHNEKLLKGLYEVLTQFRDRIFNTNTDCQSLPALERAKIILQICREAYSSAEIKPVYRGKPITELQAIQVNCLHYCRILIA